MMNYDQMMTGLGEFGTYQKRLFIIMFFIAIPNGLHLTSTVFNNITPGFRCAVPGLSNDSYAIQSPDHKSLVQGAVPRGADGEPYSHCRIYHNENNALLQNGSQAISGGENDTKMACNRWVYDDEDVFSQIVDFDLVCDRVMYKAHGNLMLLVGMIVGSLLGGVLSDLIGRKTVVIVGTVAQSMVGCLMAFSPSIYIVMACKFCLTVTGSTAFLAVCVLLAESVGVSKRSVSTIAAMLGFTAGQFVLTLIQFLVRDWRVAQLVQSTPFLLYFGFWWFIKESPRWLLTKNRRKEAQAVIKQIYEVNKVRLSQEMELMMSDDEDDAIKSCDAKGIDDVSSHVAIWRLLCSSRKIAFRIVLLCFSWLTINMVYYGLVFGVGDLIDGNIYINFSLQSSMEAISNVICTLILEKTDRKKIFCSTMILSGMTTLGIGTFILAQKETQLLSIGLFCVGKLCISIGFSLIFIITTELLPTRIRNSGLGFCSMVGRFSGVASPYIVSAGLLIPGPFGKAFPLLVFGVFSLLSGLSALLLPETRNKQLPETFDENQNQTGVP